MLYLDSAATTRPRPEVVQLVAAHLEEPPGNPSSAHPAGLSKRKSLHQSRESIALIMGVPLEGVIFTASGTEADNLAIKGVLYREGKIKGRLVTCELEHKAVVESAQWFESIGGKVDWVKITPATGQVDLDHLAKLVGPETALVSLQHCNSETGLIQDLAAISRVIRAGNPDCLFHSDGVQAFGKLPVDLAKLGVDLYSLSAHKIHGVPGAGALIQTKRMLIEAQLSGGGQEMGKRSGTENLPAILGFAKAAKLAMSQLEESFETVEAWSWEFISALKEAVPEIELIAGNQRSPYILTLIFHGMLGEVLLHHLAAKGIYVSQGSACQARSKNLSPVLRSLGLSDDSIRSSLRLSLAPMELTMGPAETAKVVAEVVEGIRGLG